MSLAPLPIDAVLDELIAQLRQHRSVVLRAPTGAGKTTRVPAALFQKGFAGQGKIVLLEPRRLAARSAARRMAFEDGSNLGDRFGYHVRFDRKASANTRVLVVTPGILLRMIQDDPFLESVSVILFDEFHERGLEGDTALGMARLLQQTVRADLRLLIMSATIDTDRIAEQLRCPIVISDGRLFPVQIHYEPKPSDQSLPFATAQSIFRWLANTEGDLLVFLPGLGEIRQTQKELESFAETENVAICPLYGDLPSEQQDAALLPQHRRKIILSTNVAETSVTVEGITTVIDTGLARLLVFDPSVGLDRLELTPISQSSADQRTGRAGRTRPGICVRMWSEMSHRVRDYQTPPEITRVDLAGAILQLLALGETGILSFPWIDLPSQERVDRALQLLELLGAVENGTLTNEGKLLARLPVHPRIGKLLLRGRSEEVAVAAALLSERDPFMRKFDLTDRRTPTNSDLLDRVETLQEFKRTGKTDFEIGTLNKNAARFLLQASDQFDRLIREELSTEEAKGVPEESLLRSLLAAFPDRVVKRRERGSRKGIMVGGRGVYLTASSGVLEPELFLAIDVDAGDSETLVRVASGIERGWLSLSSQTEVEFDDIGEKVVAYRRSRYKDLLIEEGSSPLPKEEEVVRVLVDAAGKDLSNIVPPPDSDTGNWLLRVRWLRKWMPESELPEFNEQELKEILVWLSGGKKSFAELRKADWFQAFKSKLTYSQVQIVEREAPEKIEVPSGSRISLTYELGKSPILAVRIQELFGLSETPRIAGGKVKVLLHLLAPNFRPQQVTDDLANFWVNTYPIVRKELRARYPKHSWPDDPLTAEPLRGAKRKPI